MTAVCQQHKLFFILCLPDVEKSSFFRTTLERCKVKPCNYHIAELFLYFDKMNCINLSRLFLRKCFQQHRKVYPEVPPRVEYYVSDFGMTLIPHLENIIQWGQENFSTIMDNRKKKVT